MDFKICSLVAGEIETMKELKNTKIVIMGIQGSGKTELGKYIVNSTLCKNPYWYLVNLDDMKGLQSKVNIVKADLKSFEEFDGLCGDLIRLAEKGKCDMVVIDEADMLVPKTVENLQKYRNMHNLFINHRHFGKGITVMFMTRRPQDLNPLVVESCEHKFIFALETSDNILRKMASLDSDIPDMMRTITKDSHKFIHKRLGEKPVIKNPIPLKVKGGVKKNGENAKSA